MNMEMTLLSHVQSQFGSNKFESQVVRIKFSFPFVAQWDIHHFQLQRCDSQDYISVFRPKRKIGNIKIIFLLNAFLLKVSNQ